MIKKFISFCIVFPGLFITTAFSANQVVTNNLNSGPGSLRQAVADVNGYGTITFNLPAGNEVITINSVILINKPLTIDGSNTAGSGTRVTVQATLPGSTGMKVFYFSGAGTSTNTYLQNLILKGGFPSGEDGGTIFANTVTLYITNCDISGSKCLRGGGIFAVYCNLNMNSCNIQNCSTENSGSGGALFSYGSNVNCTSCTFTGNSSNRGGALFCNTGSTVTLTGCTFSGNSVSSGGYGGAIHNETSSTTNIFNSAFNNNSSTNSIGGALMVLGNVNVRSSTFTGNSAIQGAAFYNQGNLTIVSSTISGNTAGTGNGGGIYNAGATLYLLNSIIINNTAGSGGDLSLSGTCRLYYCWYNSISGSFPAQSTAPNITTSYLTGNLAALANNGGPTSTMALNRTAPGAGNGTFVYYNATDGYYFPDIQPVPVYHRLNNFTINPTAVAGDKITTDQNSVAISTPPSIGSYDEPYAGIWNGAVDNDWNNPNNWTPALVPTYLVSVTIPPALTPVISSDPPVIKNLTIGTGATITVMPGKTLTVKGNVVNN